LPMKGSREIVDITVAEPFGNLRNAGIRVHKVIHGHVHSCLDHCFKWTDAKVFAEAFTEMGNAHAVLSCQGCEVLLYTVIALDHLHGMLHRCLVSGVSALHFALFDKVADQLLQQACSEHTGSACLLVGQYDAS